MLSWGRCASFIHKILPQVFYKKLSDIYITFRVRLWTSNPSAAALVLSASQSSSSRRQLNLVNSSLTARHGCGHRDHEPRGRRQLPQGGAEGGVSLRAHPHQRHQGGQLQGPRPALLLHSGQGRGMVITWHFSFSYPWKLFLESNLWVIISFDVFMLHEASWRLWFWYTTPHWTDHFFCLRWSLVGMTEWPRCPRGRGRSWPSAPTWVTAPRVSPAASRPTPHSCLTLSSSTSDKLTDALNQEILYQIMICNMCQHLKFKGLNVFCIRILTFIFCYSFIFHQIKDFSNRKASYPSACPPSSQQYKIQLFIHYI